MRRRFPLSFKLMLALLLTAAVPITALVSLSLYLEKTVQADMEQKVETTLELAINMEDSLLTEGLLAMRQAAAAMSTDPQIVEAAAGQGPKPDLSRFVKAFPRADMLLVVNRDGVVLVRANSENRGDRFLLGGLVQKVMDEGTWMTYPALVAPDEIRRESEQIQKMVDMPILATPRSTDPRVGRRVETALTLAGVVPLMGPGGKAVGAAIALDVLNRDFRIVDEVARRSASDVPMNATIAMDGIRVTTNVKLTTPEGSLTEHRALGTIYSDVVMDALRQGEVYKGRAQVVGQAQRTIYRPMMDFQGRVIAGPYVGIPEEYFTSLGTSVSKSVRLAIFTGSVVLAIAAALALWLGHRGIVEPVRLFTYSLRSGNIESRITHPAQDEIGDLAAELDDMLSRVRDALAQLRLVADDVARASSALHDTATLTHEQADVALRNVSQSQEDARELQRGAVETISRLKQLEQAVGALADGARRQERSVAYTGRVIEEIAAATREARERVERAMDSAQKLTSGARAGLKRAADFTAGLALLRQEARGSEQRRRALELLSDPSDLLSGMASVAETLADDVRYLALTVQENQARVSFIQEEMARVGNVVAGTANSTHTAGESAGAVIGWMDRMAATTADVAREVVAIQESIESIASANGRLHDMSGRMLEQADRLRVAMDRLRS